MMGTTKGSIATIYIPEDFELFEDGVDVEEVLPAADLTPTPFPIDCSGNDDIKVVIKEL